jgi:hypothetical protein
MSQFKLATLEKLKTDMLLSAPHIHRDYVHPDGTTSNTPPTTPKQEQKISSTLVFYHDQSFYR